MFIKYNDVVYISIAKLLFKHNSQKNCNYIQITPLFTHLIHNINKLNLFYSPMIKLFFLNVATNSFIKSTILLEQFNIYCHIIIYIMHANLAKNNIMSTDSIILFATLTIIIKLYNYCLTILWFHHHFLFRNIENILLSVSTIENYT